jgi:IclR family transcriptional regulator, KDG regulon repressor
MTRKSNNPDYESKAVKSAERVLDIFILLAQHPEGLKLKDISLALKIPFSSLHALLNTMKTRGFIERQESSLIYQLSRKIHKLIPANPQPEEDLITVAGPVLDRVNQETRETVSLSVLVGTQVVFIARRSSSATIQVVQSLGTSFPAHTCGSGKVMLAYLPEEEIDRLYPQEELARLTPNTITSKTRLKEELKIVRANGYAFDNVESVDEVWAVAGCIHAPDGRAFAATSIVVPKFRVNPQLETRWCRLITEAAVEITQRLNSNL